MLRAARYIVAAMFAALTFASCRDSGTSPEPVVATVVMAGLPTERVLVVGDSLTLSASARDASGKALADALVTWTSSNPGVATVSARGVVTGRSTGGATITVTSGAASDTATLSIRVGVTPPSPSATTPAVQTVLDGRVTFSIPPGGVPAGVARLTVGPAVAPPANVDLVPGTAFDFGPSGTQFAQPLKLTLTFDPASVAASERAGLAIYHVVGADYEEVLGSVVDADATQVSAPISSFSSYAILRRAAVASVAMSAGDRQTVGAGTAVPVRPAVRVVDARGRPVRLAIVMFAVVSGDGSLTGAEQITDERGIATVGSWTLGRPGGANTLSATVGALAPVIFTATGLPPSQLAITAQPSSATAGVAIARVVVTVQDASNSTAVSFNGPVAVALGSNPGSATLGGSTTVNAIAGVATFSTLTINRPGNGYTIVASAEGLASATTTPFSVTVGTPAQLVFTRSPESRNAGAPLTAQVSAYDAAGNATPAFVGVIQLSLVQTTGGATLAGVSSATAAGGVANFANLVISRAGGPYKLGASANGLLSATSDPFNVAVGPAALLNLVGGGGQIGLQNTPLSLPIVVQVADAAGNPFVSASVPVTFQVVQGGGTVTPGTALTTSVGQASTAWTLGPTTGTQSISAALNGVVALTITAIAQGPPALYLYSEYSYYYSYQWNDNLGIGLHRTAWVETASAVTSPITVTLAHTGTARTSVPMMVTIPAGSNSATFNIAGTSEGVDQLVATAAGYATATAATIVDKRPLFLDFNGPEPRRVGDSVFVRLFIDAYNSTLAAPATFTLTPSASIQFVSGGTPIGSVTIPANQYFVGLWLKAVAPGAGTFTIAHPNFQTFSSSFTVVP